MADLGTTLPTTDSVVNDITGGKQFPSRTGRMSTDSVVNEITGGSDTPPSFSGSFADHMFSQGTLGKMSEAFIGGLKSGVQGADDVTKAMDESLRRGGFYKQPGQKPPQTISDYIKESGQSFNEAFLRPIINGIVATGVIDLAGIGAPISAAGAGLQNIASEGVEEEKRFEKQHPGATNTALGETAKAAYGYVGGMGEAASAAGAGEWLPEFHIGVPHGEPTRTIMQTYEQRTKAVIGEGQEGFFNTKPVSPENQAAREEFAHEAGVAPRGPEPLVTDPKVLAPQMAPDLFQEYREKLAYQDELADRLEALKPSGNVPGIIADKSPEYLQAQEAFTDNYRRLKELEPQIQEAHDHARDLIPPQEPTEAPTEVNREPEAPVPAEEKAPVVPSQAIYDNVKQMVMDAGRSEEEAEAAAKLAQARYQVRAEQFKGKRGTAEDLFQEDFPHIQKGKFEEAPEADIRSLHQAVQGDRLRVARKFPDGRVVIGNPGEMHADLITDQEMDRKAVGHVGILESDMGFATPDGKFLSRQEAMEYAKKAHEGINEELIGAGPRDKDKLESTGYEQELDKLRQKEDASSKLPPHLQEPSPTFEGRQTRQEKTSFGKRVLNQDAVNDNYGKVTQIGQKQELNAGIYWDEARDKYNEFHTKLHEKYGDGILLKATNEEVAKLQDLNRRSEIRPPFYKKLPVIEGAENPYLPKPYRSPPIDWRNFFRQSKARGQININETRNIIHIFENADASTVFHELGHDWLEQLHSDAAHPDAPPELKRDLQVVRDWLGAEPETEITTAQHEKFARGFERYLREGKAPSEGLKAVFEQFKKWLTQIYKTVKELRSPITDDVRAVFDRMLSTEEENKPEEPKSNVAEPTAEQNQGKPEGRGQGTSPSVGESPTTQGATPRIVGTGETRVRGLAKKLEDDARASGLADKLTQLPEYKGLVIKEAIQIASDLALNHFDLAREILAGREPVPVGTTIRNIFDAASEVALQKGDLNSIEEFSQSIAPRAVGEAAQLMRAGVREGYENANPATALLRIREARERAMTKRLKGKDLEAQQKELMDNLTRNYKEMKPDDFRDLVKSIECDY